MRKLSAIVADLRQVGAHAFELLAEAIERVNFDEASIESEAGDTGLYVKAARADVKDAWTLSLATFDIYWSELRRLSRADLNAAKAGKLTWREIKARNTRRHSRSGKAKHTPRTVYARMLEMWAQLSEAKQVAFRKHIGK